MFRNFIILTPRIDGKDGVSHVSRLVVAAMIPAIQKSGGSLSVLALSGSNLGMDSSSGVLFRSGDGRVREFVRAVSRVLLSADNETLVVILHLNLGPSAIAAFLRQLSCITFLHGVEAWKKLTFPRLLALKNSRLLITNSEFTAQKFIAANPSCESKLIRKCHLGVGSDRPYSLTPGSFALMVGRMSSNERYKGHDLAIEIWPSVLKEHPGAELVVAGTGDDEKRLKQKARAFGVAKAVSFLGDVSDEALALLYSSCRFFVMPSEREGFGLVFLEAMRAGRACIGGFGAAAEIIEDGSTGFLVSQSAPELLRKRILELFKNPDLAFEMGTRGRQRYQERFTDIDFRRRWMQLIDSF